MCKDLGFDILAVSETHKWRSDTDPVFFRAARSLNGAACKNARDDHGQNHPEAENGAGWDTSYASQSTAWCAKSC